MKLFSRAGSEGFRIAALICALAGLASVAAYAGLPQQTTVGQDLTIAPSQPAQKPVLPWINDVVKMRDAGVPQDVIEVYVKNSRSHSSLSADDVLYLQSHGLSGSVITAMIEKGGNPTPAPVYAPPPQSTAQYSQPPAYTQQPPPYEYQPQQQPAYQTPDYGYDGSSVSVSYVGTPYYYYYYNYPYYYPYYYSYYPYYYYPYYYYPAHFHDGHFHDGHDHFGFHPHPVTAANRFNNGTHFGVGSRGFNTQRKSAPAFSSPRMSAPSFSAPRMSSPHVGFSGGGTRASFSAGGGMRMARR